MNSILFVCLGNICRSPACQAMCERLAAEHQMSLHIASCGLGDWHTGQLPDPRMRKSAKKRGLALVTTAQELEPRFFEEFDYILAADRSILREVQRRAKGKNVKGTICLLTEFSRQYQGQDIPDPYHGSSEDFEHTLDMIEEACSELIHHLTN